MKDPTPEPATRYLFFSRPKGGRRIHIREALVDRVDAAHQRALCKANPARWYKPRVASEFGVDWLKRDLCPICYGWMTETEKATLLPGEVGTAMYELAKLGRERKPE